MIVSLRGGDTLKDRIRRIRKDVNLTQAEFSEMLGASRGMIAKYETGVVIPDKSIRMLICQKFNVNEAWLETGEGDPYKEGLVPALEIALNKMPAVHDALERLLPVLSDEDLETINQLVQKIINAK